MHFGRTVVPRRTTGSLLPPASLSNKLLYQRTQFCRGGANVVKPYKGEARLTVLRL